jgi:hypothetical protein
MQIPRMSIRWLRSSAGGPVPFESEHLDACIPVIRPFTAVAGSPKITYRAYLASVQRFILKHWDLLREILSAQAFPAAIESVDIIAEKHGAEYHPARVEFRGGCTKTCFIVNVAVTDRGRNGLTNEFKTANILHEKFRTDFIPKAYCLDQEDISSADQDISSAVMVLGEWFNTYHEFHRSVEERDGSSTIALWDLDRGYEFLSRGKSGQVYQGASSVLTYFYDVETFEEIFPWHHAAGDFVVRHEHDSIDVKLIATRQYAARVGFAADDPENRVMSLMMFLTNLTVRMRLDRLDGVGEVVWADDDCVDATVRGFFDAMKKKVADGSCDRDTWSHLLDTLKESSPTEWARLFQALIGSYDRAAPDLPVIEENLAAHVFRVYSCFQDLTASLT